MMNRRKPRVVIPTNVVNLIATATRVSETAGSDTSIANGSDLIAGPIGSLNLALADANAIVPRIFAAHEESQIALASRNETMSMMRDILIRVRDTSVAITGDRQSPGECGFEVIQSNSRSGAARVRIPTNPEQFIALADRVFVTVTGKANNLLTAAVFGLDGLVTEARVRQNAAVARREAWQLLISQRRAVTERITDSLRRLRDIGFSIAGPRNYESVSTMGFVVHSSATQNSSTAGNTLSPDVIFADIALDAATLVAALANGATVNDYGLVGELGQNITLEQFTAAATSNDDFPASEALALAAWNSVLNPPVFAVSDLVEYLNDATGRGATPESVGFENGQQMVNRNQFVQAVVGSGEGSAAEAGEAFDALFQDENS